MCGGDDHLAWKHLVSLETCRGLCIVKGSIFGAQSRLAFLDQSQRQVDQSIRLARPERGYSRPRSEDRWAAGLAALPQDSAQYDSAAPPPPLLNQSVPHPTPYALHSQTNATPLPVVTPIQESEDAHARVDRFEQKMKQMRVSDRAIDWNDFDGAPVASLLAQFRMLEIERYTSMGCLKIHLRSYSNASHHRTWNDLTQEFLRLFAFNTVIDISRRELEALRQRPENFRSLVQALYGIEEGIAKGLWPESSPTDSNGKKPSRGQRPGNVGAINSE
ncbi:hypothetical protein CK203_051426 [Vitis vinifera]|uniref:Retrotransposon gag domain-containing protein n=1 Tax=Vitis vinifera TaxID=29760 RepID=A0A438H1V1_VITVI|nr:hypothetical protein CK203_051426 [Vitis vinifera]